MGSCDTKRITYDADPGEAVVAGDVLVTSTSRLYLVVKARKVLSRRHVNRFALETVVIESAPPDATTHRLVWYRRGK